MCGCPLPSIVFLQGVVEVIDNILEPNNEAGWGAFEEVSTKSEKQSRSLLFSSCVE